MKSSESKNKPSSFDIEDESAEFKKRYNVENSNPQADATSLLKQPSTMVIAILLCAILVLTLQFGNLQH
jgi:hypothetical protein